MIVKFLPNKGGGSAGATMNYLLGRRRDREHTRILQGNPELTERLADNLDFKRRYTVGVLSFEESNISETAKREIMASFEQSLLAGLEADQYNICWIEHKDKDRLELNFVIPNVELTTGKRLQPYYDRADRPLVESWKQVINHQYGLSDPHDPRKAQAVKIDPHRLPESVQAIKKTIGRVIHQQIEKGAVTSRTGVLELLTQSGFEIARITDKSISVKNPSGKRNIRLEGFIYENRRFGSELGAERTRARQDYDRTSAQRYNEALGNLQRAVAIKSQSNAKHYQRPPNEPTTGFKPPKYQQDHHRGGVGTDDGLSAGTRLSQSLALQQIPRHGKRIKTNRAEHTKNPPTSQSLSQGADWAKQRWLYLDTAQESQEVSSWQRLQRQQPPNHLGLTNYAKRLDERLQRFAGRIGDTIQRAYHPDIDPSRANQAIDDAERAITSHGRELSERKQGVFACVTAIGQREREAEQREQQASQREREINQFVAGQNQRPRGLER